MHRPATVLPPVVAALLACSTQTSPERQASETPTSQISPAEPVAVTTTVAATHGVLPRAVTSFGASTHDDSVYVLGGYFGTPHEYSSSGQSGDFLRLHGETGRWERLGTVEPAQSVALVTVGDALVRVGGMRAHNEDGEPQDLHSLTTVARFDPQTLRWTELPELPQPRSSHDAAALGSHVFVVGGWTMRGRLDPEWATTLLSLDLERPDAGWQAVDAPFRRRALATAALGELVAVLGGMTPEREISGRLDLYDPRSQQWSRGPEFPGSAFGVAATGLDGVLYASGSDGVVYAWQPGDDQWHRVATMAYPRFFHRMIPSRAGLLALGGIRPMKSGQRVRPLEHIPVSTAPETRQPTMLAIELDSPMASKNRQGLAILEDSLVVFGGNKSLGQHDFAREFFNDETFALDLAALEWSPLADYPQPRQTMSTMTTPWGHVVALGGFGHDDESARSQPEIYAYNPRKNEWRQVGALAGRGRTQFELAVHDDAVWMFGGLDYDPNRPEDQQFRHVTEVLKAPLSARELTFESAGVDLREPRRAFGGAMLGSRFVMVGGMKDGFALVDTCEAFDFATQQWSTLPCPRDARLSPEMVELDGRLYLAGGSSKPAPEAKLQANRALERYDPATNTWSVMIPELPIEPKHLRMFAYGQRLLLWSTHNDEGKVQLLLVDPKH